MKHWMTDLLVCPQCLPEEKTLNLDAENRSGDDIIDGRLSCPACNTTYPIENGIALVLPREARHLLTDETGYNSDAMVSSYLWSHYCDIFDDPDATHAYDVWSEGFSAGTGTALDIGCAVGRLSFEMSRHHERVIGIDTSKSFIAKARQLLLKKRLDFDLIIEGQITENRSIEFQNGWHYDKIEFIVADAMALPFGRGSFSTAASINILEKVPDPRNHFTEINRLLKKTNSLFIFSDPFSWDAGFSDPETWLSGLTKGKFKGRGMDNITKILEGMDQIFDPPMTVTDQKDVAWKIRKTQNLWEYINSQMIVGSRP